jgi:hypothetical protein
VSARIVSACTVGARTVRDRLERVLGDRPGTVLTRHFFTSMFDFGFLSADGAESLKRALLGCLAGAIAIGLLLTRVFMAKYGALSTAPAEIYERAVIADHAFLMAVPMWIVAAAVGLVGHTLFPDRTDFRVLMAEPLSRLTVFASKLASLLLFVSLFIAGTHVALLPLAALTMTGAMKTGSVLTTSAAFAFSSVIGSVCAALAVVAVHGALVLLAPRARLLAFSGTVRSVLIGMLVLSLPLVGRLPATAEAFASGTWWLVWAPPAWFVGLERWLIGDTSRAALAAQAGTATVVVFAVTVASYVLLYRRFDRLVLQPGASQDSRGGRRSLERWIGRVGRAPVRHAVGRFVWITIRRSVLHQGLVVAMLAATGGFVLNGLLSVDGWSEPLRTSGRSPLLLALLGAPMMTMFLAIPAIRLALSVPLEPQSNWIFRMTEDVAGRAEVAAANVGIVLRLGVVLPLAMFGPLQWWMLGPSSFGIIVIEALTGWLLVEWAMADWRRIPFTCSYIPGKGFVPLMFLKGFNAYVFFAFLSTLILRLSLERPRVVLAVAAAIGVTAGVLSAHRRRNAPETPLIFQDKLPTDVNPLRLDIE